MFQNSLSKEASVSWMKALLSGYHSLPASLGVKDQVLTVGPWGPSSVAPSLTSSSSFSALLCEFLECIRKTSALGTLHWLFPLHMSFQMPAGSLSYLLKVFTQMSPSQGDFPCPLHLNPPTPQPHGPHIHTLPISLPYLFSLIAIITI